MADAFLKPLPSHNVENFSRYARPTTFSRNALEKPKLYIPRCEHPAEQIIVTEKTSILLRYLHKQWSKKENPKKRSGSVEDQDGTGTSTSDPLPDPAHAAPSTSNSASGADSSSASATVSRPPRRKMPRTS